MTHSDGAVLDPGTGIAIPQQRLGGRVGMLRPDVRGTATITYRCHSCGESIIRSWEVLFVDVTPGHEYASTIVPARPGRGMTTHHEWHLQSPQRED